MDFLEYFPGGVPAKTIYEMNIEQLSKIIELTSTDDKANNKSIEVCFIALISYFEAFMKDHFASLINICPSLLEDLDKNGQDVTINSSDLLLLRDSHINRIGFLLSEKYDFGTANKINALYMSLLKITPFSKDDKNRFAQMLNDRNLIVHHGGIYSLSYSKEKHASIEVSENAYFHSLTINLQYFKDALSFLGTIVDKTTTSTSEKLQKHMNENILHVNHERTKALDALTWRL